MNRIGNTASRSISPPGCFPLARHANAKRLHVWQAIIGSVDGVFRLPVLEAMSPELIDILVCPRSKKKLVLADTATLDRVNALIAAGKCREISGTAVSEPLAEGLWQRETGIFYPVRDGIPVLIYDNAVELK